MGVLASVAPAAEPLPPKAREESDEGYLIGV